MNVDREVVRAGHVGDTDTARRALSSHDATTVALGLSALCRLGAILPDELQAGLNGAEPALRRRAAQLLPRCDFSVEDRPSILPLLSDPDDRVVEMAAFAAGELTPAEPGTVAQLCEIGVSHSDSLCREAAIAALGSLGDPDGLEAILAATKDRAPVRRRATLALAAFEGPEVEAALERLQTDRDLQVRQAAEDLLAISGGTQLQSEPE